MLAEISMTYAATIDAFGITAPDFNTVLVGLTAQYRGIYGQDAYLEPDSQDGALLAILALALHDTNSLAIAVYQAFSPGTAQGEGLSSIVKINGITRHVQAYSTCDILIVGQVGTVIADGIVTDPAGGRWIMYGIIVIPESGQVTATATFEAAGAVAAPPNSLIVIGSPTRGWQTATNPASAALGDPVESDATLRLRQRDSTALPSRSVLSGIQGGVLSLVGVVRSNAYENDTDITDARGIPSHSIAMVVDGGDAQSVANIIGARKGPGVGTYGTTSQTVTDVYAIPRPIKFFRPTIVPIEVAVTIQALPGYVTPTGLAISAAVAAYINSLAIAAPVRLTRLYVPIDAVSATFNVTALTIRRSGGTFAAVDLVLLFNEAASCVPASVTLTVAP